MSASRTANLPALRAIERTLAAPSGHRTSTWTASAATLRASPARTLRQVMLPLALPSMLAGAGMTWARALGEFGATITFAGNLPGVTQTMPLAVYVALQTDLDAAVAMSVILLALSVGILLSIRLAPSWIGGFDRARAGRP